MKRMKKDDRINPDNEILVRKFIQSLRVDGFAENTMLAYKFDLDQFQRINDFQFLKENIDSQFHNFIKKYKSWRLKTSGYEPSYSSIVRKVTSIRSFYYYLFRVKEIDLLPDFINNFKIERVKTESLKILSKDDIENLINSCRNNYEKFNHNKKLFWLMMEALIETLYSSGMRISEALSLTVNQVFDNQGKILNEVSIIGKGGKSRVIFLNHKAQKIILNLLEEKFSSKDYFYIKNSKDHLFNSRKVMMKGDVSKITYLSVSRIKVYHVMKKLALKNGINPKKISPHAFRHSVAVHLLLSKNNDKQNNIALIKSFLGHSSIDTTKIYLGYEDAENLKRVVNQNHPLAKLSIQSMVKKET